MSKPIFICQLPITEQQRIIFRATRYLRATGMDEKIVNVLNEDGSFCA